MSSPNESRPEHPSTYFVEDRTNQDELTRVHLQDHLLTASMGGVLPEQSNLPPLNRILDVGCGTGGWLIEMAKTYPNIVQLIGVDVSQNMCSYARMQAEKQHMSDRCEFHAMDALRMLEFPSGSFDLVNQRLGASFLRTWEWTRLLSEYERMTQPGGLVRITEPNLVWQSESPALNAISKLWMDAFYQSGHAFSFTVDGVSSHLPALLQQHGFDNVQTHEHFLAYEGGTPAGEQFAEDIRLGLRTAAPFIRKWTQMPDNYDALCQQALEEITQPGFVVTWRLLTVWGTKPLAV